MGVVQLVRALGAVTQEQVDAARALDADRMHALNARRSDLQFQLEVELVEGPTLSDDDRVELVLAATDLHKAEHRLETLVGAVNQTLSVALPTRTRTYGRKGRWAG